MADPESHQMQSTPGAQHVHDKHPRLAKGDVLLRAEKVVKGFPGVWENLILDEVDFDVRSGEVHVVLGENGAGKTVLANVLSGFYSATRGQIYIRGKPATINSPEDALRLGVAMVHQEFTLVRPLTVAENVALGLKKNNLSFPIGEVERKLSELSAKYNLKVDPKARVEDLSVGEQQRAEILKVLYHDPDVIILDEPTSVLTPTESQQLFSILRGLADEGKGVILITHKMEDVMRNSDRVTVLKLGKLSGTKNTSETNGQELVRMMIGPEVPVLPRVRPSAKGKVAVEVSDLYVLGGEGDPAVRGASLTVHEGEILGIAGVAGNGQTELVEAITGLRSVVGGKITIFGQDMTNRSPKEIAKLGVSHIPEERRRTGTAEGLPLMENLMMKDYRMSPFSKAGFLDIPAIKKHCEKLVSEFEILTPDLDKTEARILSGGNIQRMILARELWKEPRVVVASHPTYGLDLRAIEHTHRLLLKLREKGSAVFLVSEDLDEIMALSDRIAVMFNGKVIGIKESGEANAQEIGLMMAGIVK
jgi:general nucleoside transport system ATP-binding protein